MTELIFQDRKTIDRESRYEIKIWEVSISSAFPEGIKYSMVIVENDKMIICYDNAHNKGHHRHIFGKQEDIAYRDIDNLLIQFNDCVDEYKKLKKEGGDDEAKKSEY